MNYLRKIRKNQELTMKDIANVLNLTEQQIQRIETGKARLNEDQIRTLCNFFKCSSDYLLGITEYETKASEFTKEEEKRIKEILEKNADYLKELIKKWKEEIKIC